jgi:hypothetical protein
VVGLFLNGRLGTLVFDPFDQATVEFVTVIKRKYDKPRQYPYGLICTAEVAEQFIDTDRLRRKLPYQNLYSRSFVVLPARPSVISAVGLSQALWSQTDEGPQIKVFVPEPGSMVEEVLKGGSKVLPLRLLGINSSGISGSTASTKRLEAAVYCISNQIRWLDSDPDPARRGPYTIVGFDYGYLKCLREGNVPFRELALLVDPSSYG